ncbi:hypothetical protein S40285_00635 [Stachybotrys chlorohalonatus IBT 40285]|uniref:Protein kinase domain-containing protein n=1 Tax=Stachybotrys chlorohalonatus (strain IBT 40285) TaxID=1283841 RepID=A0A084R2H7_STAC4|nr:hypothetical protein S40285_00635 [Stachybotrys chlorohalonata IBT 40285]
MELSEQSIHDVIHPTAAFALSTQGAGRGGSSESERLTWEESLLNPKNRIDSLDVIHQPLWKIDGCTAFGSQFYAVPLTNSPLTPLRIDLFIPEPATLSAKMKEILDVDVTFHTKDSSRISHLGITRHLLRILQHWSQTEAFPSGFPYAFPFGSRIVLSNLPLKVEDARITVARAHHLERQFLSLSTLRRLWDDGLQWPPAIDINTLEYQAQIHDSTCLVKIKGERYIFKALTGTTKYMYHELRQLLRIPAHQHVISWPTHLVTKTCSFGGKVAVVGFTLVYHSRGSLRDLLPFLRLHNLSSLADEARWSLQLASALLHIRETTGIFYPDLRLDNIVLSDSGDAVMVDFEQRGVWCEFAAPEINAIEYIRLLAVDTEIPVQVQTRYASILSSLLPDWEDRYQGEDYEWPSTGYNIPWECLDPAEQEACEVYMLGRVLWCIFEARSAPQRAAVWQSYRWEPLKEFPEYTRTPEPMRGLIDRCTKGRRPGLSRLVVREANKLVLREPREPGHLGQSMPQQIQETARDWWKQEMDFSEKWLVERAARMRDGTWDRNYYGRPTLRQVHDEIRDFCTSNGVRV